MGNSPKSRHQNKNYFKILKNIQVPKYANTYIKWLNNFHVAITFFTWFWLVFKYFNKPTLTRWTCIVLQQKQQQTWQLLPLSPVSSVMHTSAVLFVSYWEPPFYSHQSHCDSSNWVTYQLQITENEANLTNGEIPLETYNLSYFSNEVIIIHIRT